MRSMRWAIAAAAACAAIAAPAAFADEGAITIYRSTVQPLPGNLPSVGAEAYAFSEFGDEVTFAHHARRLRTVTVTMSSWGCQSGHWYSGDCSTTAGARFSLPITLNLYRTATPASSTDPVVPGALIASVTKTFSLPYRPSASPRCTGTQAGEWFLKHQGCFNGKAANIVFSLGSLHLRLPNRAVYGIAYNTTHYGYDPIGEAAPCFTSSGGCPYDSLNIGLGPKVFVGSKPYPDTVFQSTIASEYCDAGMTSPVAVPNEFNLDSPDNACWVGYVPAVQFRAATS